MNEETTFMALSLGSHIQSLTVIELDNYSIPRGAFRLL